MKQALLQIWRAHPGSRQRADKASAGPSSTASKRLAAAAVASVLAVGAVGTMAPLKAHAVTTFNVTLAPYGADPTGVKDSGKAIQAAINDAQAAGAGSVVYLPAGHYALLQQIAGVNSLTVAGAAPITLLGDGPTASVIIEHIGKNALDVQTDGTVINNLELDTQTFDQRSALVVNANNTLLENSTILGGTNTFAVFYSGPANATRYNLIYDTGNTVNNVTVNDRWTLDGFSFSYQQNGLIQNVTHTGSRLALFIDKNVTVNSYNYTPGTQAGGTQGFWITPPSDSVTVNNFVTNGNGGTLGSNTGGWTSTNIAINNEVFNQPGFHLSIGEVNGLTITGCNFGSNSTLRFMELGLATGVVVKNCSALPVVRFTSSGTVSAEFDNNTYPTFTPVPQEGTQTFLNSGGPADFTVSGGTFQNCAGGFFKGPGTTFGVSGLAGYPCGPDSAPAASIAVTNVATPALSVSADASASTDGDATPIADYQFNWGDGTSSARQASATLSHTYAAANTYTVTVTVLDTAGLFATASQQVVVAADQAPVARLTVTPGSGPAPLAVSADASASTDTDPTPISTYTFDFGDGTVVGPQAAATATHTYTTAGPFTAKVTVTDTAGLQSSASQAVTVNSPNLVGNSGFELGLTGWKAGPGTSLTRSSTAHSGSFSAQISRTAKTGRAMLADSPPWNTSTTAGTTCTLTAWVLGPVGVKIFARTIEANGTTTFSTHTGSVKSTGAWTLVSVTAPIVNTGDVLAAQFYEPLTFNTQTLLIDDVSEVCQ